MSPDPARLAAEYARHHVGGMQPTQSIGDRLRAAFLAGRASVEEQRASTMSREELRTALINLDIPTKAFRASDGYMSVAVRTREDAADLVLAFLVEQGIIPAADGEQLDVR